MAFGAVVLSSCSFIDDFDFEVADGGAVDDAAIGDAGERPDGSEPVDGGPVDGGDPDTCTDPCLGDAVLDFDTTQGAGSLAWSYLRDERDPEGLDYSPLTAGTLYDAPAWTDGTPPPAIVNCTGVTTAQCSVAPDALLFEANQPGDGSDPVLTFVAPSDGTYAVVADVTSVDGMAELMVSRMSRHDVVNTASFSGPGSLTAAVDLLAGERSVIRVSPVSSAGGDVSLAARVRVSRAAASPLADCQLALTFEDGGLEAGCEAPDFAETGATPTMIEPGPSDVHGGSRLFPETAALRAADHRNDYSEDFTLQLWARVDSLEAGDPFIYSDLVAVDSATASGINLVVRRDAGGDHMFEVQYAFPFREDIPSDGSVTCDTACRGSILVDMPPLGEWHFFRIVRDKDSEEFRVCIDGQQVGSGWLASDVELPSPGSPKLGTTGVGAPRFEGAIDDLRVFSSVLPCGR